MIKFQPQLINEFSELFSLISIDQTEKDMQHGNIIVALFYITVLSVLHGEKNAWIDTLSVSSRHSAAAVTVVHQCILAVRLT